MRKNILAILFLPFCPLLMQTKKVGHVWSVGKIVDESRARYFAGMQNDSYSQSSVNGAWNGSANSTSIGDSTYTQANGNYS